MEVALIVVLVILLNFGVFIVIGLASWLGSRERSSRQSAVIDLKTRQEAARSKPREPLNENRISTNDDPRRQVEAAEGKLKVRIGDTYRRVGSLAEVFELIDDGTVPPDAEIYYPAYERWMTVEEFDHFAQHSKPKILKRKRGSKTGAKKNEGTGQPNGEKAADVTLKTMGCVFGYAVWCGTMLVAVYVLRDLFEGTSAPPLFQLAVLVGALLLPLVGFGYWWEKAKKL
jgi:hypothetical protein